MALTYKTLSSNFAKVKDKSVAQLGTFIGGKVGENIKSEVFKNGCAIRLSYAFNYSGVPISPSDGAVSSGADKKWYLYRVSDMKKFIIKHIGGTPLKGSTANSFKGQKGVIVFNDCNWSDATGHVDLFNGIQCEYEAANDYFNNCNSELLYTLK